MVRVHCETAVEMEGGRPVLSFATDFRARRRISRVPLDEETARAIRRALQEVEP